ncbi:hypothetical protein CEQ90_20300, partial [Lewinellaceae bacterium SD302]
MLFMVCCLFVAGGLLAQNPCENQPEVGVPYTAITQNVPSFTLIDISASGTLLGTGDDAAFTAALEHPFTYFGTMMTDLRISTNGYISDDLTDNGPDLSNDCALPSNYSTSGGDGNAAARLYPYHDDVNVTMGIVLQYDMPSIYPHAADATMGAHVIQWDGVHFGGAAQVLFQTVLYDNGDIVYIIDMTGGENGSGSTTGWNGSGGAAATDFFTFACDAAGSVPDGSNFAISAHGTDDFADAVAACQMNTGLEEVNLAAVTEVNVTLNENCRAMLLPSQVLTGDFDVDGNDSFPSAEAYNLVVMDNDPSNGPIIDGCGTWQWTVTPDPEQIAGLTGAWGFVNAEDKTSPDTIQLPTSADELFCDDVDLVNINVLPSNVSRCWTQDGTGANTLFGSMNPQLRARLVAGGDGSNYVDLNGNTIPNGIPYFFDGCSNVEICVNDIVVNGDACEDVVITRVFTATDGDCPSVSGEENPATVVSYNITFTRPSISDVNGVDSLAQFSCDENPPLLPPNAFGNQNPAPTPQDFPFITLASGGQIFLDAEGFCNLGATFQDGPRIITCDQTYKFVRTFTVIDWCEVDSIRTFTQLVKVGDFDAPTIVAPTQDLNFDGIPDQGPLFFSTNTADCEAIFAIPAGTTSDNCDPNP